MNRLQKVLTASLATGMFSCAITNQQKNKCIFTVSNVALANGYDVQMKYGGDASILLIGKYKGSGEGPEHFDKGQGMIMALEKTGDTTIDEIVASKNLYRHPSLVELATRERVTDIYVVMRALRSLDERQKKK